MNCKFQVDGLCGDGETEYLTKAGGSQPASQMISFSDRIFLRTTNNPTKTHSIKQQQSFSISRIIDTTAPLCPTHIYLNILLLVIQASSIFFHKKSQIKDGASYKLRIFMRQLCFVPKERENSLV